MMMEVSVKSIKAVHKEDGVRKFLYENTIAIGNNDSPGRKSENRRKTRLHMDTLIGLSPRESLQFEGYEPLEPLFSFVKEPIQHQEDKSLDRMEL